MSHNAPARFARYIGIDYSGAKTADASLPGLRIYQAEGDTPPQEVLPPPSARGKHWSRRGVFNWLSKQLAAGPPIIIGIDHGFSFPLAYFERYALAANWPDFLADFQAHWPTDQDEITVETIRRSASGGLANRSGSARWRRLCEQRTKAKSVFHFDVPGSVAKSTHAGLPWLRRLREQFASSLHFWPFDGWLPPAGHSVITEIYPSLWSHTLPRADRTPDQQDAYAVATWLQATDQQGLLPEYFQPLLTPSEAEMAGIEGWILGVK